MKDCNLKRHYESKCSTYNDFTGQLRKNKENTGNKSTNRQSLFKNAKKEKTHFTISKIVMKHFKPFTD